MPALPLSETLEGEVGKATNVRGPECTSEDIPEYSQAMYMTKPRAMGFYDKVPFSTAIH
jgi:hypothetical protein